MAKSDENSDQIVPEWELGNEREHNFGCFPPSCDANANADARRQTCELPLTQKVELENVHSLALIFALTLSYEPEQRKCKLKRETQGLSSSVYEQNTRSVMVYGSETIEIAGISGVMSCEKRGILNPWDHAGTLRQARKRSNIKIN